MASTRRPITLGGDHGEAVGDIAKDQGDRLRSQPMENEGALPPTLHKPGVDHRTEMMAQCRNA